MPARKTPRQMGSRNAADACDRISDAITNKLFGALTIPAHLTSLTPMKVQLAFAHPVEARLVATARDTDATLLNVNLKYT